MASPLNEPAEPDVVHKLSGDGVYCVCGEVFECTAVWAARNHKLVADGRPPARSRKQKPPST